MLQSKVLNFFGFLRCLSLVCLIFPIVLTAYLHLSLGSVRAIDLRCKL